MVRNFFSMLLVMLLRACNLQMPDHDPQAVFADPEIYRVSNELVEMMRAKDVEGFLDRAHPDVATQGDIRMKMAQFYSYFPDEDDFEITHYYSELLIGQGKYAGMPIFLTAYDVVGKNKFAQLLLEVSALNGECCVAMYWQIVPMNIRP